MVWIILLLILILLIAVVLMLRIVAIPISTVYLFNPFSISWVFGRSRVCANLFAMAAFGFVEKVDAEEQGLQGSESRQVKVEKEEEDDKRGDPGTWCYGQAYE